MYENSKRIWTQIVLVSTGLALGSSQDRAAAGWGTPPSILNPKTYASPSKKFALYVNPSDPRGRGKGTYRLTLDGRELWAGEKPYTLWEATVAGDGVVTGYAYSNGIEGYSEAGHRAGMGDFRVVILDPGGKERLDFTTKREDSHFLHQGPNPIASGLILDEANDRVVFRISDDDINRQAESWWIYELSTGREKARFRPKELISDPAPIRYIMGAKLVEGTPLILIHWWRYHWDEEKKRGARFTLVDLDGKPVWSLDLLDDYEIPGDDEAEERLTMSLRHSGGILKSDKAARFDLRFAKDVQRVTFGITRSASGAWVVSEIERRPFVEPTIPKPKAPEIPILSLRQTATIVLKSPSSGPEPEIRRVGDFVFDASGRIAFIRGLEDGSLTLMVIDQLGKILHKVPLDPSHAENRGGWSEITGVGGGRFLLIRDNPNNRDVMEGAVVDVATGKTTPIPGFKTSILAKVAGFPDGGFVVKGGLTYFRGGCTSDDTLNYFDGKGRKLRVLQGSGDFKELNSFYASPRDLAATTNGMIATLDGSRNLVQFFDRAGKHHHTIDLGKAWSRKPNYLSEIAADRDGGGVIEDFEGEPPLVRMNKDGAVRAQIRPKLVDGRTFRLSDFKVSPEGALWASDGHALYRLDESGVADRTLGDASNLQSLDKVAAVTIDGKGRIYAVVARTGAVHIFDQDGRWIRVCLPGGDDVAGELSLTQITVADSGDIHLDI